VAGGLTADQPLPLRWAGHGQGLAQRRLKLGAVSRVGFVPMASRTVLRSSGRPPRATSRMPVSDSPHARKAATSAAVTEAASAATLFGEVHHRHVGRVEPGPPVVVAMPTTVSASLEPVTQHLAVRQRASSWSAACAPRPASPAHIRAGSMFSLMASA